MAIIAPFKGIRYSSKKFLDLSKVLTPPYDIISPEAQQEFYDTHENNIIRIELGKEMDKDNDSNNKYTRAGDFLSQWMSEGILEAESEPALYIYEQEFPISEWTHKTRRGLIALVKLSDFSEGVVLPHEFTLSKAKQDRFNLMSATDANISQIFSLYNDRGMISSILSSFADVNVPEVEYKTSEGITEKLWVIKDSALLTQISKEFDGKQLFIADGHHRYETALSYRNKKATENPNHTGEEPYNFVMMTLVSMDDPGLVVSPTHRVVTSDNFSSDAFLTFAEEYFTLRAVAFNTATDPALLPQNIQLALQQSSQFGKAFGYYDGLGEYYYILSLRDSSVMKDLLLDKSDAYRDLDVAILHTVILEQYFKIDADNLANQKSLSYVKDIKEAIELVNRKQFDCAFFLNPTELEQLKNVSLANEKMPQKSTYFYPKLITGLVMNKF